LIHSLHFKGQLEQFIKYTKVYIAAFYQKIGTIQLLLIDFTLQFQDLKLIYRSLS